jgi:hypothetical protein
MRLPRSNLVPMLVIMAGAAVGVLALSAREASSRAEEARALALLDENGSLLEGVTGTWVLSVDLGRRGSGNATFVLEQEGSSITGTYTGAMGRRVEVSGTAEDGTVELSFDSAEGVVTYEGTLDGITMSGKCVYGDLAEGTFRGRIRG